MNYHGHGVDDLGRFVFFRGLAAKKRPTLSVVVARVGLAAVIFGTEAFETLGPGMSAQLGFAGVSATWAYILCLRLSVKAGATNLYAGDFRGAGEHFAVRRGPVSALPPSTGGCLRS